MVHVSDLTLYDYASYVCMGVHGWDSQFGREILVGDWDIVYRRNNANFEMICSNHTLTRFVRHLGWVME